MGRIIRTVVVTAAIVSAVGLGPAGAEPAGEELTPRVQVASPWSKDDTVGEADRPQGDVRRVVVENGRQNVRLTFRMVAKPFWDTFATSRRTFMAFRIDWQGTTPAYNRRVSVSWAEGSYHSVVYNQLGHSICVGGAQPLPNHGIRVTLPATGSPNCMGGAHVLRVAGVFSDDHADDASNDIFRDHVPNSGGYGPFIRLPN